MYHVLLADYDLQPYRHKALLQLQLLLFRLRLLDTTKKASKMLQLYCHLCCVSINDYLTTELSKNDTFYVILCGFGGNL